MWSATGSSTHDNRIVYSSPPGANWTYDAAGDVTSDGSNDYLYDGAGRLCAVENLQSGPPYDMTGYVYDAAGSRVGKGTIPTTFSCNSSNGLAITSGYVVGLSGEQLTETNGGTGWLHTHVFANGQLLATYSSTDTLFELTDWLGTRRADVGASGCKTTWQSLPYGDDLISGPNSNCSDSSELHFTGKERDAESGLDYFINRYYGSSMGRFSSPDPSGLFYADPTNPQSMNLYAYVQNNPLVNFDPDGLDCFTTSNLTSTSVTVTTYVGATSCDGIAGGHYVDGSINTSSYGAAVGSDGDAHVSFSYTPTDSGSIIGSDGGTATIQGPSWGTSDIGAAVQGDGSMFSMSQDDRIQALAQGVTADTQHSVGCIAGAYGFGGPSAASGGAGTNLWNSSQNLVGKARFGGALGGSTAYTSEAAMAARASSWGSVPFRVPTPVGTPFTGSFAMRSSSTLGGAAGRYAPYAGAAGKFLGVAGTAYSSYRLWNCLGGG